MQAIKCWRDFEEFGIDALTGESCGYAMRLLCDVTASGKAIIEQFFGNRITIEPGSNWNSGSKNDPHVGSIMLPRSIIVDLGAFCLLQNAPEDSMVVCIKEHVTDDMGYAARYARADMDAMRKRWHDAVEAPQDGDDAPFDQLFEQWARVRVKRWYKRPDSSVVGRNRHAMSGRTE